MEPVSADGPGRRRDPLLEQRVFDAACTLYARHGWAGTSVEAVAREAKVGKSSIYRRWSDAESLLIDSLAARIELPLDIDTGSVRNDLVVLARAIAALFHSDVGEPLVRLSAEAASIPQLWPRWRSFVDTSIASMSDIVQRGIDRGEVPADTNVLVLLDAIFGGLLIHYLSGADRRSPHSVSDDNYAEQLVDLVLRVPDA